MESTGDDRTTSRTKTVVIQAKDLEAAIVGEEGNHRVHRSSSKGIVTEVDLYERSLVLQRVADRGKCLRDFRDQTTSENVCEISDLLCTISIPVSLKMP